jgi:cytochrome c oxidase cbb3-type subunit 3
MFLFYLTIFFAIVYMINYHVLGKQNLMIDEYTQEIMDAQKQKEELTKSGALINEDNVTVLTDAADLQKGKDIFTINCIPCHGNNGEGIVGPNLTDDYWINGGGIKNVFRTIKEGVAAKGMISWKTQLNPKQMQSVASYVLSLHGTKPPNGKAPEGNLWIDSTAINTKVKTDSTGSKQDTVKKK